MSEIELSEETWLALLKDAVAKRIREDGASVSPTGLSQVEPQEGLARSGFDPSRDEIEDDSFFPVRFIAGGILWLFQSDEAGKEAQINLSREGGVALARAILRAYGERSA